MGPIASTSPALRPLFWARGLPYDEVKLNMTRRIALNVAQTVNTNAESS